MYIEIYTHWDETNYIKIHVRYMARVLLQYSAMVGRLFLLWLNSSFNVFNIVYNI